MTDRIAGFPDYEPDRRPGGVRRLLGFVLLLQSYSLGYGALLLLMGLFSGWMPVVVGAGHVAMGVAFVAARSGVARRSWASIFLLRALAIFLASILPVYAIAEGPGPGFEASTAGFLGVVAASGVVLFLLTLQTDFLAWMRTRDETVAPGAIRE